MVCLLASCGNESKNSKVQLEKEKQKLEKFQEYTEQSEIWLTICDDKHQQIASALENGNLNDAIHVAEVMYKEYLNSKKLIKENDIPKEMKEINKFYYKSISSKATAYGYLKKALENFPNLISSEKTKKKYESYMKNYKDSMEYSNQDVAIAIAKSLPIIIQQEKVVEELEKKVEEHKEKTNGQTKKAETKTNAKISDSKEKAKKAEPKKESIETTNQKKPDSVVENKLANENISVRKDVLDSILLEKLPNCGIGVDSNFGKSTMYKIYLDDSDEWGSCSMYFDSEIMTVEMTYFADKEDVVFFYYVKCNGCINDDLKDKFESLFVAPIKKVAKAKGNLSSDRVLFSIGNQP